MSLIAFHIQHIVQNSVVTFILYCGNIPFVDGLTIQIRINHVGVVPRRAIPLKRAGKLNTNLPSIVGQTLVSQEKTKSSSGLLRAVDVIQLL